MKKTELERKISELGLGSWGLVWAIRSDNGRCHVGSRIQADGFPGRISIEEFRMVRRVRNPFCLTRVASTEQNHPSSHVSSSEHGQRLARQFRNHASNFERVGNELCLLSASDPNRIAELGARLENGRGGTPAASNPRFCGERRRVGASLSSLFALATSNNYGLVEPRRGFGARWIGWTVHLHGTALAAGHSRHIRPWRDIR